MAIITRKHAAKLIRTGMAIEAGRMVCQRGNGSIATYMAITRYDIQRTDHYLIGEGDLIH